MPPLNSKPGAHFIVLPLGITGLPVGGGVVVSARAPMQNEQNKKIDRYFIIYLRPGQPLFFYARSTEVPCHGRTRMEDRTNEISTFVDSSASRTHRVPFQRVS